MSTNYYISSIPEGTLTSTNTNSISSCWVDTGFNKYNSKAYNYYSPINNECITFGGNITDTTWYPSTPNWDGQILKKLEEIIKNLEKKPAKLPSFPHSNVYIDAEHTLHMELAMAGYSKDDITVDISRTNELYIKAIAKEPRKDVCFLHTGIKNKDIDIQLQLDSVYDGEVATVEFSNGILKITVPRKSEYKVKRLTVS